MTSSNDSLWQRPEDAPGTTPARPASASLVDPEDDLSPAGYAADFSTAGTTTVIPAHDANTGAAGYHMLDPQEPLPYVQPHQPARHIPAGPAVVDFGDDDDRMPVTGRRGTQNLGLLILRIGLGAVLIMNGLRKLFGWWGGPGLDGFRDSLSEVGYQHADLLAYVGSGGEIAAGALLVLGLFTPIAAAGALAFLINGLLAGAAARPPASRLAYFLPDGYEYQLSLIVMAVAVILVGPGRYGLDVNRNWATRPFIGSFITLLAGIAAGVALWVLLNGVNPVG
ncbi:DoxX family protein [Mycobacterium sp.]|uniref:DoxX family protein n=1 Tax=Mycobacterium sp. TaxID=1785 RepID=UPI003A86525A